LKAAVLALKARAAREDRKAEEPRRSADDIVVWSWESEERKTSVEKDWKNSRTSRSFGLCTPAPNGRRVGDSGPAPKKSCGHPDVKIGARHGQSRRIYVAKRLLPKSRELSISDSQKRLGNLKLPVTRGLLTSPLFHFHSGFEP